MAEKWFLILANPSKVLLPFRSQIHFWQKNDRISRIFLASIDTSRWNIVFENKLKKLMRFCHQIESIYAAQWDEDFFICTIHCVPGIVRLLSWVLGTEHRSYTIKKDMLLSMFVWNDYDLQRIWSFSFLHILSQPWFGITITCFYFY